MPNKKKRIIAITGTIEESRFLLGIGKKFSDAGFRFELICNRKYIIDSVDGPEKKFLTFPSCDKGPVSSDTMRSLDKIYPDPGMIAMVSADITLRFNLRSLKRVSKLLLWWKSFLEADKPVAILSYPTSFHVGRTAYAVARTLGIPFLTIQTGPLALDSFTLCDKGESWLWSELFEPQPNALSTKISPSWVAEKVREDKGKSLKFVEMPIWTSSRELLGTFKLLAKHGSWDALQWESSKIKLHQALRTPLAKLAITYDDIPKNPFVFFPLHIPWDAQIATRNPQFSDQLNLVQIISKSLPYGVDLAIKEHPYFFGGTPLGELRKIRKLGNIKILHPSEDSLDIIRESSAVATINSTAGWEAFLMKKPLMVLGKVFYYFAPHVWKIDRLDSIPTSVRQALSFDKIQHEDFDSKHSDFVKHVLSTSYPGSPFLYKSYMGYEIRLHDDNFSKVSESILDKIHRLEV